MQQEPHTNQICDVVNLPRTEQSIYEQNNVVQVNVVMYPNPERVKTERRNKFYEAGHVKHFGSNVVHKIINHAENQYRKDKQTSKSDETPCTQHNDNNMNMAVTKPSQQESETNN